MTKAMLGLASLALAAACASGLPRPPQGPGPGGTEFGYWARDAEGSVDASFRRHITQRWNVGQEAEARVVLERDGFTCQDGNRPEARPVPALECERLYEVDDDVHAWIVRFWPNQGEPEVHYQRTHKRDPLKNYNDPRN